MELTSGKFPDFLCNFFAFENLKIMQKDILILSLHIY